MTAFSDDDRRFMAAAIRLSLRHSGQTLTNPSVGCILVKDGAIVGSAVTAIGGRPHAETQALDVAGENARGATAYVTLEPCSHYGKTPPCANALVAAGVARVVVSLPDPDPRVAGRGFSILREAGIVVETGLLADEARRALAGYLMRQTAHRPFVTIKLAVSTDGMIGRRGEEVSITGPLARTQVHILRAESDAILVGIGTVRSDDPELTVRLPGMADRSPIRIILDRRLELPLTSNLVRTARDVPVIAAVVGDDLPLLATAIGEADRVAHEASCSCCASAHAVDSQRSDAAGLETEGREAAAPVCIDDPLVARGEDLQQAGVEILQATSLEQLLHMLASRGISTLFVEGGAKVACLFVEAGFADRIILSQGPGTIGPGGLESPLTPSNMPSGYRMIRSEMFGPDRCFEYERVL